MSDITIDGKTFTRRDGKWSVAENRYFIEDKLTLEVLDLVEGLQNRLEQLTFLKGDLRVRSSWYYCERTVDGKWEREFQKNPNLKAWDYISPVLFDDDDNRSTKDPDGS